MKQLPGIWWKIVSTGISNDLTFQEKKITRLMNILVSFGIPISLCFSVINIYNSYLGLATINLLVTCGGLLILFINKQRRFLTGRVIIMLLSIAVFTASALLYNNGGEYFLLVNVVATVILFHHRTYVVVMSSLNALVFIAIIYLRYTGSIPPQIEQVSHWRILFNLTWALVFIVITLNYFKLEHLNYQQAVESSNEQLRLQQIQLTQQKNELEQKGKELHTLNQTKEKLFSVIAHDLRSPIASLKSCLQLYEDEIITKEEFDTVTQQLTLQVDTLYNTMDTLLQWSHTQLDGIHAHPKPTLLKLLVSKCITLLQHNAKAKAIHIEQQVPDNVVALVDPNHLKVVVRNLLSNAIKFSYENSSIQVGCKLAGDVVELYVKDEGTGIQSEQLPTLFSSKVHSERGTSNETGTGLGLTLCHEFITKNNGSISVISEAGKGSTFTISIPSTT
jgi:two-component system sensor histidine kinase/response regulator